ncbi:major intracellular serine protease [Anaerocolumna jejuensis DSM 15929]|uniref:Major intracellular serine protease n=1 Tax=Anaerocolumna jejuensis DSM 15929 TaxID=1121322 RepID=A0A1M7AGF3_9FIRM|nr:S8 family peptidase [Anaerocolumna jejuensis]SHL41881.1 major intracellular serine protease [Anaerocolumna jejuensis DSM 15929]
MKFISKFHTNWKKERVGLIPFDVQEIHEEASEIPQGIQLINAPYLWEAGKKGDGVVVAIIDTGCQTDHPDLAGRIIGGKNFSSDYSKNPAKYEDNNGHGTHVAGTIAAIENNAGVVGVAPLVKLLIVKVLDKNGSGSYQNIIDGINYAVAWRGSNGEKVRVISMSLGGPSDVTKLHNAVKNAVAKDVLVVCAAGNEGDNNSNTNEYSYPAAYAESIAVGAVDFNKKIASFSNSNDNVDLVAPGVGILSTYMGGKYATLSGTSMATPHVSGASALIINASESKYNRTLTEAELYAQLIKKTVDLGIDKRSQGNGLLDLSKE